jgi:hypothetical protein
MRTIQEPGEEAGRPRPHGESSEAPRELVSQQGEHEGSPGLKAMTAAGHDTRRMWLCEDEGCDAEKVEAE